MDGGTFSAVANRPNALTDGLRTPRSRSLRQLRLQEEVAQALRRSVRSVARLRTAGELAWLPGSPIMIQKTELTEYLERRMVKRQAAEPSARREAAKPTPAAKAAAMLDGLEQSGQSAGLLKLRRQTRGKT